MMRLAAGLLLLLSTACLAQDDPAIEALKARQRNLKEKKESVVSRDDARAERGQELQRLIEISIADMAAKGVDFKKLSDAEATAKFPHYQKVSGRADDGIVVRVDNAYTHELELVAQPVGGRRVRISWAFYKDGSFKVGEDPARGGQVFFTGDNYLDAGSVKGRRAELRSGLVKFITSATEK